MENFTWLYFIMLAFASFRLTHLLVYDDITDRLRHIFIERTEQYDDEQQLVVMHEARGTGLRRWIGLILMCHWCTGIWSSIFLTVLFLLVPGAIWLIVILAAAGVAAIIESIALRL
ncbi:DUF1360 domain-containing protein [Paenibacillus marinisediminis]